MVEAGDLSPLKGIQPTVGRRRRECLRDASWLLVKGRDVRRSEPRPGAFAARRRRECSLDVPWLLLRDGRSWRPVPAQGGYPCGRPPGGGVPGGRFVVAGEGPRRTAR